MIDLQPEGANNGEIPLDHQIIDLIDRTRRGIFNWENTVLAQPLFDGAKHSFKGLEIHDKGILEDFLTGKLRKCPLYTLTGNHGRLGKQLGGVFDGVCNGLIQRR